MPHEVTIREDGTAEMAYFGKRPWHGLGQELDGPATAQEAIESAHMDWEVVTQPVYLNNNPDDAEEWMGFPGGWTLLLAGRTGSESLATEWSRWWQVMRSVLSQLG